MGRRRARFYLDEPTPVRHRRTKCWCSSFSSKSALATEAEELKIRRQFLPPADYQKEFERIMVALARVERDIRVRKGGSN